MTRPTGRAREKAAEVEWQIAFFRSGNQAPGLAWLQALDPNVRRQYLIWLAALRLWKPGPYALPAGVPWWHAMKDDMKGIYEIPGSQAMTLAVIIFYAMV